MTKSELANQRRADLTDHEVIAMALSCVDCGKLRISLFQAVALASEVDNLDQWFDLVDPAEELPSKPLRALPAVSIVAPHCLKLAARAVKRRRR
jgi:hypothetical protein